MKKLILAFALFASFAVGFSIDARAQNLTSVSASNITDINGTKLAAGQLCFLITDQQDNPISVSIGGGGQALKRGYCSPVAAGVVTAFTVPNPSATSPAGIYYRVTVKDSSTGQEVLRYSGVTFTGATFNFDSYAPVTLGSFAPLTGNAVSGNLSVSGNVAATGTVTGSNIAGGQINTGTGTTNALLKYTTGASGITGNSDLTDDGNKLTVSDSLNVTGNTGLPAATSGGLGYWMVANVGTPSENRTYCGDGTGWQCEWAKRAASVDTLLARLTDGGVYDVLTGFRVNGAAASGNVLRGNGTNFVGSTLAAADLSNGVTGSGAAVLAISPSLTTPAIGSAGAAFAGSTSGTSTLKAAATASGTQTLTAGTYNIVGDSLTQTLTGKTLTTPIIGTTTISEAPRMVLASGFQPGNLAAGNLGSAAISKGVTVEAIAVHSLTSAVCTVNPSIRVRNSGSTVITPTLTLTTGTSDWNTTGNAVNYAGADLLFIEVTSAGTCTTPPSNIIVNVTGRMQ